MKIANNTTIEIIKVYEGLSGRKILFDIIEWEDGVIAAPAPPDIDSVPIKQIKILSRAIELVLSEKNK